MEQTENVDYVFFHCAKEIVRLSEANRTAVLVQLVLRFLPDGLLISPVHGLQPETPDQPLTADPPRLPPEPPPIADLQSDMSLVISSSGHPRKRNRE